MHPIRPRDNVPVLSWLILRGRCRDCKTPIAVRYPLVEAGTAFAFALVASHFGLAWELPAYLYAAAIAVALGLIDVDTRRLPDRIVLPSYPVVLGLLAVASWAPGGLSDWASYGRALAAGAIMFAGYFALAFVYPQGMGFGDVKLSGVVGLYLGWLGWGTLAVGWFGAFLLGGVYSIALLALRRATRKSALPFGPWMLAGMAVGIAFGESISRWYLDVILVG